MLHSANASDFGTTLCEFRRTPAATPTVLNLARALPVSCSGTASSHTCYRSRAHERAAGKARLN